MRSIRHGTRSPGTAKLPRLDRRERSPIGPGSLLALCGPGCLRIERWPIHRHRDHDRRGRTRLGNEDVCFVGIGAPSAACNLARLTHAPDIMLIYESGTIGTRPDTLPLSIGDGELCETALTTVSVAEMFRYWLQGGRITKGFLGGAQIDRFANINTTVIGDYHKPRVRLPGGGGAPEIATSCERDPDHHAAVQAQLRDEARLRHLARLRRGRRRSRAARRPHQGTTRVMTDLCVMEPEPGTKELRVTSIHPGVTREHVAANTGWPVRFADGASETPAPTGTSSRCCARCRPGPPPPMARRARARRPDGPASRRLWRRGVTRPSSAITSARRSAGSAARLPACAPTTSPRSRSRR